MASVSAMVQLARNVGGAVGTSALGVLIVVVSLGTGLVWVFAALAFTAAVGAAVGARTDRLPAIG